MAIGKLLLAASLTGGLAAGALAYNGGENIQAVKNYAESMKGKVAGLASDVQFLNNTITGKNGQIGHHKGRIAELEETINRLTTDKEQLQLQVEALTAENQKIHVLETQLVGLNTSIAELEREISGLETKLAALQTDYNNAVTELDKANGEITKANQDSQALKDYVATLEAEATILYESAKVDPSNPIYAVETPSSDPIATIQGLHWTNPQEAFYDDAVFNLLGELMQEEPIAGTGDYGWTATYTVEAPVLNDGKMDALFEYIAKNSDITADQQVFTFEFGQVNTGGSIIYGVYNLHPDTTTGQYIVKKF